MATDQNTPPSPAKHIDLAALIKRLEEHADGIENLAARSMADDMRLAALVINQLVQEIRTAATTTNGTIAAPRRPGGMAVTIKKVILELPADEARALAQLVKRLGYDDAERLSSRYDGGEERDVMLSGINKLQRALAEAGFAPR